MSYRSVKARHRLHTLKGVPPSLKRYNGLGAASFGRHDYVEFLLTDVEWQFYREATYYLNNQLRTNYYVRGICAEVE